MARAIGDPRDVLLPPHATQEVYDYWEEKLGLDRPYHEQYILFIGSIFRGEFGISSRTRQPIGPVFFRSLQNSAKLIIVTVPIALLLSIPLGIIAASRIGTIWAKITMTIAVFGQAAPTFFSGLLLIWIFSVRLGVLPAARMEGPSSYILPGVTMSFAILASQTRFLRNSMLRILSSDFIKLVRLKGAPERIVLWKHALKNGSLLFLTNAGMIFARIVIGMVAVETVFAWPGVGRLIYSGIVSRDYALIQVSIMFITMCVVVMSLVVDFIYALIDPRIRVS